MLRRSLTPRERELLGVVETQIGKIEVTELTPYRKIRFARLRNWLGWEVIPDIDMQTESESKGGLTHRAYVVGLGVLLRIYPDEQFPEQHDTYYTLFVTGQGRESAIEKLLEYVESPYFIFPLNNQRHRVIKALSERRADIYLSLQQPDGTEVLFEPPYYVPGSGWHLVVAQDK